jgi:hypothetical protein
MDDLDEQSGYAQCMAKNQVLRSTDKSRDRRRRCMWPRHHLERYTERDRELNKELSFHRFVVVQVLLIECQSLTPTVVVQS